MAVDLKGHSNNAPQIASTRDDRHPHIVVTLWRPKTLVDWIDHLLFGRGRYPRGSRTLIRLDAEDLLNRMTGGEAYAFAGRMSRAVPPIIDVGRAAGHWQYVRRALADHLGIRVGGSGYD